jgi:RNA polymerase sigma-70 factor (ECF subfamily)
VRRRPDIELAVLAREGSAEAAGALFDRYWVLAWRTAYAVTADRTLADDAAQEAFVKAFAALGRFDELQPFAPWLKRIAINAAARSRTRSPSRTSCATSLSASPRTRTASCRISSRPSTSASIGRRRAKRSESSGRRPRPRSVRT